MQQPTSDAITPDSQVIEVRVAELKQLFNAMDASPFRDQDLDPAAEEFIVGWAREAPRGARLALLVDLDRAAPPVELADEPTALRVAIRAFFTHRANVSRSRRRQLLRVGRVSLLVGLLFLVGAMGLGDFIGNVLKGRELGELLRQGLSIIGWVAMWRPVEIFLYGWWPIHTEATLYDRLSEMPVQIAYRAASEPGARDAWRHDWPALPSIQRPQKSPPHPVPGRDGNAKPAMPDPMRDRGPVASTIAPGAERSEETGA